MRIVRWLLGFAAGLMLLAIAVVLAVTLWVDPNRFKGRIEGMVHEATGRPFEISGNLKIAWFPWLAVQTGPAQLGAGLPLVQWQSARVGARLIPLLRGQLLVNRVRLDGLQVHLRRTRDGKANWDNLFAARTGTYPRRPAPEIGGLEIRNGAFEYADARSDIYVALSDWQLDIGEWQDGKPVSVNTRFKLQKDAASTLRIPIELAIPKLEVHTSPVRVSIPAFDLHLADAQLTGSVALQNTSPVHAAGALSLKVNSLRKLLADVGISGPRPRDGKTLGALQMTTRWAVNSGAVAVKPIAMQLDQTKLTGELVRSNDAAPVWSFSLHGDQIALHRYIEIEDIDSEPFELPTATLQALRVRGVLAFDEAQLSGAQMKDIRLRLVLEDGLLRSKATP